MKLYKLTQSTLRYINTTGFYDSAVVAAESEEAARETHPNDGVVGWSNVGLYWRMRTDDVYDVWTDEDWPSPSSVTVTYIGDAAPGIEAGVIVASYNPE